MRTRNGCKERKVGELFKEIYFSKKYLQICLIETYNEQFSLILNKVWNQKNITIFFYFTFFSIVSISVPYYRVKPALKEHQLNHLSLSKKSVKS